MRGRPAARDSRRLYELFRDARTAQRGRGDGWKTYWHYLQCCRLLREAVIISLLSLIPPDRVGVVRKLRYGHTLKRRTDGTLTDGEVQWAAVQVDVAAERLKAAEHTMLVAQRELADRALLATKMSEAKALSVSAARLAELAQQRQHDAALAEEQATLAAQRKQEADEGLEDARAKEREAMEAVAELRSSLSSSESDASDA